MGQVKAKICRISDMRMFEAFGRVMDMHCDIEIKKPVQM